MKIEAKINNDIMKDLRRDVEKYLKTYAKESSKYASKKLTEKAQYCMKYFYDDYSPKYYNRTYDLRDNSYSPYIHNNGNVYYGGVKISSDNMSPYYSSFSKVNTSDYTDPIIIARLGWNGYHGNFEPVFEPAYDTTPTPLEILKEYFYSNEFYNDVQGYASRKAKEQNYKYLGDYL